MEFGNRLFALAEGLEPHPTQDRRRLGELDVPVIDNLDVIAPRVAEVKRPARLNGDAVFSQTFADALLVVDHQAEMPRSVRGLSTTRGQGDELIADVNERHPVAVTAAQLKLKHAFIPSKGLIDVTDLKGDVVDSDQASHGLQFGTVAHEQRCRARRQIINHRTTGDCTTAPPVKQAGARFTVTDAAGPRNMVAAARH